MKSLQSRILVVAVNGNVGNSFIFEELDKINGEEALKEIQLNGDPRIIFLDLRMPVMNGIEFLEHYDAPQHKDTTVIVFSNYDAQKEVDKAYNLGAHRYVLKARAAPKELIRIVEDTLAETA